ncbi:MAG: hypothetical protein V8Q84_09715 [Bilophila sp.]
MLPTLSPEETYQRLQQGEIRLIDIRETNEYAGVSIPAPGWCRSRSSPAIP